MVITKRMNKRTQLVEKIVFPDVDPLSDSGRVKDLFSKK
jgi:hypothetical protein